MTTQFNEKEPWLTDLIDEQSRAELQRAYDVLRITGNRLDECKGLKRQPRTLKRRFIAASRQFKFLVHQAALSQRLLQRAA